MARLGAVAGPLLGGFLVGLGVELIWNFVVFAAVSAIGGAIILWLPAVPASPEDTDAPDQDRAPHTPASI